MIWARPSGNSDATKMSCVFSILQFMHVLVRTLAQVQDGTRLPSFFFL